MRKSLTIIGKVQKGTKSYYDILVENKSKPKCCIKRNSVLSNNINWYTKFYTIQKLHEVKLKRFQIRLVHKILAANVTLERMKVRNVQYVIHTVEIFLTCFGDVILYNTSGQCLKHFRMKSV